MTIEISLNYSLTFIFKIIFILTGIILFFWNIKPFRKIEIYFSIFIISPILIFTCWIFDGLLGALVASIILAPFQPNISEYQINDYRIYKENTGFLDSCCDYEITEREFLFLEKRIDKILIDGDIDFEKSKLESENGILKFTYEYENYDYELEKTVKGDSTIIIGTK